MKSPPAPNPADLMKQEFREEIPHLLAAIRSPVPLFLTGLFATWAGYHTGQNPSLTLAYTLFGYLLSLLACIDLKHGILPHTLTGLLLTLGTLLAPTLGLTYWNSTIAALTASGGLFICALITERLTGQKALGGGDLWLTMALGAWLGMSSLPMLVVATALTGLLSILIKRWLTAGYPTQHATPNTQHFPFGPALCAAGWLALLYGPTYWKFMEMLTSSAS